VLVWTECAHVASHALHGAESQLWILAYNVRCQP
jgi:hypothetical protein